MSEQQHQPQQDNGGAVLVAVLAGLAVAVALPLVIGWKAAPVLAEQPRAWQAQRRQTLAAVAAGVVAVALFVLAMFAGWLSPLPLGWNTAAVVALWWAATAPLGYAVARARFGYLATAVAEGRHDPRTADRVRRAVWEAAQRNAAAKAQALQDPRDLAVTLNDDRRDIVTRLRDSRERSRRKRSAWVQADTLTMPEAPPRALVFGGSGSGKTTLLRALTRAALAAGWRVVVIDAKGNHADAAQMLADGTSIGASVKHWPSVPFDAWQGSGESVATKALTLLPVDAPEHYKKRADGALKAVAGSTPWRSSGDLLARLTTPAPWVATGAQLDALTRKDKGIKTHEAVADEVRAAVGSAGPLIDGGPGAWAWDDERTDLVVASVDLGASSAQRTAAALMLADLNAYRHERRGPFARPLLVIIDEAAGLLDDPQAPTVDRLMETVRSQRIGMVVAAQSVQGLGKVQAEPLIKSGASMLVGRVADPDPIVKLAGTVRVQEVAHQGTASGSARTGQTAAREQAQHRLDPDRLREAPTGCFALHEFETSATTWTQIRPAAHHHGATLPGPELRAAQRPRLSDLFPPEERPEVSPPRAEVDEGDEPDPFQDWGTP